MFVPTTIVRSMSENLERYQRLEISTMQIIGYTFEELVDLFAKGYTLIPPTHNETLLSKMAELAKKGE